jgi:integrase
VVLFWDYFVAYLNKHPNSRFYSAVFRDSTGKQCRRSTKIEAYPTALDPKERARLASEAKRKAQAVANAFERASRGELKVEQQVKATLLELSELAGGPRVKELAVEEFINQWIDDGERTGKTETTLKRYRQIIRDFLHHLGDRARIPISHLTASDVQSYLNGLKAKGLASKTISNSLKILRIPFAEGCRMGRISLNPAAAVKPPPVVSVERSAFTLVEIQTLLSSCKDFENGDEWKTTIMLGYYCGLRLGDATGLRWGNIDFEQRMISFTPEKTRARGRKMEIPIHPELERYLLTLPIKDDPKAPLTPNLQTDAGGRGWLSKAFARLLIRAGVNNPQERRKAGGRAVSTKSFHALRHSLTSHLAAAGVSPELRMKLTGHTDARTHAGYTHLEFEALREALSKLPN